METVGIYAGSFDPLTNGHVWMIEQGLRLFNKLIVAIAHNAEKKELFDRTKRCEMIRECFPGVTVECVLKNEFTATFAKRFNGTHFLRGVRNATDLGYEQVISQVNATVDSTISTVIIIPPPDLCHLSSSVIKAVLPLFGWEALVKQYVPQNVFEKLVERYAQ